MPSTLWVGSSVFHTALRLRAILYEQQAVALLCESIHTSQCLGTFPLRSTCAITAHTHTNTHRQTGWPSDEISFCHLACCVTRCICPARASTSTPAPSLPGVSPKATHIMEESRTPGDGGGTAATFKMTESLSVFLLFTQSPYFYLLSTTKHASWPHTHTGLGGG